MSPVQHPVSGIALSFVLEHELQIVREQLGSATRGGRTLVKNGPLRATLVGLNAGGVLAPHKAALHATGSRRAFLRKAGIAALVAPATMGALAACTESKAAPAQGGTNTSGGTLPDHGAGHQGSAPGGA